MRCLNSECQERLLSHEGWSEEFGDYGYCDDCVEERKAERKANGMTPEKLEQLIEDYALYKTTQKQKENAA